MSIEIEMHKAQKAMSAELAASEKRLKKADEAVVAAGAALEAANAVQSATQQEFTEQSAKYQKFLELFPLNATAAAAAKAPKEAKAKTPRSDMSLIEKMVSVMGDTDMTARGVEEALLAAGLVIKTDNTNTRGYISTLLGTQTKKVKDAKGNNLRDPVTKELVRSLVFKKVDRGLYRVNKVDVAAIEAELEAKFQAFIAAKQGGASEVLLVDTGKSPADALFDSQGLDVDSLVSNASSFS